MIWHNHSAQEVLEQLQSDAAAGLSDSTVQQRLLEFGHNRLREQKKKTFFQRFLEQLKDVMVIILIIAAVISAILTVIEGTNDWLEPIIIIAIVLLNAVLGVIQESRAEAALDALKAMSAPHAKVVRDGTTSVINAQDLVPGDIILLEAGDFIPADARLIESASLRCDESTLTGESVPVEKNASEIVGEIAPLGDRINMIYSGCTVSYGRGKAVITETGMLCEMGKIAALLGGARQEVTPLQLKLHKLGRSLGVLALVICVLIFLYGVLTGQDLFEMFMTAVSLAVAAIPEGLPAIVTIVLARGVQRMVKMNAIIRRLPAVETLGCASVICSDKTGTLTQNRMTLMRGFANGQQFDIADRANYSTEQDLLLKYATLCCDGKVEYNPDGTLSLIGDPTETAIVAAAELAGIKKSELEIDCPRMAELPFDSDRKLMTTVNFIDGRNIAIVKGGADILFSRCKNQEQLRAAMDANEAMSKDALRVLAVACKELPEIPSNPTPQELEYNLTFIGLVGMIDPPRSEVIDAVATCKTAGIRTVMITGDHITTACAIARELGILSEGQRAITGTELSALSDAELDEQIQDFSVYARVSPEDKIRIVKAWQKQGEVVAMTGDGVNDAPALKAADIGCAMGITGTDVAKGAADMVLTDDNFATIVTAVRAGRGIFDNIRKSIQYLLSCNLGEVLAVFVTMLLWKVSPLLPIHLLWINLVTDSLPALALGMEPTEKDIMSRPPRSKSESIFAGGLGVAALLQGVMFGALSVFAYAAGLTHFFSGANDPLMAQTMVFATLAFSQLFHSFNIRSNHSLFRIGFFSNPKLLGGFVISAFLLLAVLLLPPLQAVFKLTALPMSYLGLVAGLSVLPIVLCELGKLVMWIWHKLRA